MIRWLRIDRMLRRPWVSGPIGAVLALFIVAALVTDGERAATDPDDSAPTADAPADDEPADDADPEPAPTPDPDPAPPREPAPAPDPTPDPTPAPDPEPEPPPAPGPPTATVSGELEIHFLDVGQADATLLLHDEVSILVDTGHWQRADVVPALRARGVDHLDLVVVTHPHADHLGQFAQVLREIDVDEVWWSGATATTATFSRALDALESSTAFYEEPRAGDATTLGPLAIEVLSPAAGARLSNLNDASLAMRITYGEVAVVLTGDAERDAEQQMVANHSGWLAADVLHLGHHGSNTSSSAAFLAAVDPAIAVYSAGADNTYGHPHTEVISRVEQAGITWYGTDVHGTVTVTTDGTDVQVTTGDAPAPPRDPPPERITDEPPASPPADPPPAGDPPPATGACAPGQVDINTADAATLEQITHIGPARARDLIGLRPFDSVGALRRINGIGDGRLRDIRSQGVACAS